MVKLRLATWNVMTVDDEVRRNSIFEELKEYNIDVACLQETKLLKHEFIGDVHSIFSPVPSEGKCPHGVGFACKNALVENFDGFDNCDPNRLIVIKLVLNRETIHVINVYAPTNCTSRNPKDHNDFYSCLECAFSTISQSETVFIIGDFNAQVGADNVAWPTCLGPYGVGETNDNGQRLLEFCRLHDLCVLNTYTELQESEQFTHQHQRWKTWSQLDLCITRVSDRHRVLITLPVDNLRNSFDHKMVILDIDTQLTFQNIKSDFQTTQALMLFRYLLMSCLQIAIKRKYFWPDEDLLACKVKYFFTEKLLLEDIFAKKINCIDLFKELNGYIQIFTSNQDCICIPSKEDIKNIIDRIVIISELLLETKLEIKETEFEILHEEFKSHFMKYPCIFSSKPEDIFKTIGSIVEESDINSIIYEYQIRIKLDHTDEEILKNLINKCCKELVLPEEILYIFIFQQCMNIVNVSSNLDRTGFCNNMLQLLSKCMLTGLKSLVTDGILEQHNIFKCTEERDMLFALNLLQEKCLQKIVPLYIIFVDFSHILASGTTLTSVRSFMDEPQWALYLPLLLVDARGNKTQSQKELMAYLLSYILAKSCGESGATLKLKYELNGHLFDRSRLKPKSTKTFCLNAIQYGCFAAIFETTENEIQKTLQNLEVTFNTIGLSFVQNKPSILAQNVEEIPRQFKFGPETVFTSNNVKFLGVNFPSGKFSYKTETFLRIQKVSRDYHLYDPYDSQIYYDTIYPNLIRHLEVLSLTNEQETALDKFNDRILRRFDLLSDPNGISKRIRSERLALLGHYHRDKSDSITKRILYGDLFIERKTVSFFKNLKKDLKILAIDSKEWEKVADNEEHWQRIIETLNQS